MKKESARTSLGLDKYYWVKPSFNLAPLSLNYSSSSQILIEAGFDWREPGCSMCLAMNPDKLEPGERCASTSNRNFEGRQGSGGRTHLMSPAMAAAAAVTGGLADIRKLAVSPLPPPNDGIFDRLVQEMEASKPAPKVSVAAAAASAAAAAAGKVCLWAWIQFMSVNLALD